MSPPKLPMTVVSGYLGAGKTTLINRLLAEDHGLRLLVMVNDFGAINIDADLLISSDEDTMELSNGCVCCTMGADLFMALGDALDRRPRPDHLIVEASGIADPARIANAAIAEQEMVYGGIVTVIDAQQFKALAGDAMIGPQIRAQAACADLLVISKTESPASDLLECLGHVSRAPILTGTDDAGLSRLLFDIPASSVTGSTAAAGAAPHPDHVSLAWQGDVRLGRDAIRACLQDRPAGLFRLKGQIADTDSRAWEIQVVGDEVALTEIPPVTESRIVGIGLKARASRAEIDAWWQSCLK